MPVQNNNQARHNVQICESNYYGTTQGNNALFCT